MRPSKSSCSRRRWSGWRASWRAVLEIVLRVVSLPATESSTKNAAISSSVSRSPSTSAATRLLIRSSAGRARRSSARAGATLMSVMARVGQQLRGLPARPDVLVGPADHAVRRAGGPIPGLPVLEPHHLEDRPLREPSRDLLHEVTVAGVDEVVHQTPRLVADLLLDRLHPLRRERGGDELAQLRVARGVGGEEGARGLEDVERDVLHLDALPGAEGLRVAAARDDVRVPGDGPEP